MTIEPVNKLQCSYCENQLIEGQNFCQRCGKAQHAQSAERASLQWSKIKHIGVFYGLEVICCLIPLLTENPSLESIIFLHAIFAVSSILFFSSNWQDSSRLLKWTGFSLKKLSVYIACTIVASVGVQIAVNYMNQEVFGIHYSYYDFYKGYRYGTYLMVITTALLPALFEELAYRGYLMEKLLGVFDQKETIYVTSLLFFLVHFSMTSFFWMLPFAIILARIRLKENTIWYGVVIHFFFNLTGCFLDWLSDADLNSLGDYFQKAF